ncbi:hypothetical protein JCM16303_004185 [Sporobolomyces ruberrimus]
MSNRSFRSLATGFVAASLFLFVQVAANTEIVNFGYPERFPELPSTIPAKPQSLVLLNEPKHFSIPVRHGATAEPTHTLIEFTYQLDHSSLRGRLEELQKKILKIKAKRTTRLSWPASHPADFKLELFGIPALTHRSTSSFGGYLLITAQPTLVHSPTVNPFAEIPVTIIVEPAWLGGIPESLIPVIAFAIVLVSVIVNTGLSQKVITLLTQSGTTGRVKKD